jgi:hypothetical protein
MQSTPQGDLPWFLVCEKNGTSLDTIFLSVVQSVANVYKASVKTLTPERYLSLFPACEKDGTSLDTIFLSMKLYPDVVYSSRRLAVVPGLREDWNVSGHYLLLDEAVPRCDLPMKSRESMLG